MPARCDWGSYINTFNKNRVMLLRFKNENIKQNIKTIGVFLCPMCGEEFESRLEKFKYETTYQLECCSNCSKEKWTNKRMKNHEIEPGTIKGFLKALYSGEPIIRSDGRRRSTVVCECLLCGNKITITTNTFRSGNTFSCGCLHSILEALTMKEISKYENVLFLHDKSFDKTLRSITGGGALKFDFIILKSNKQRPTSLDVIGCIECQGEQHYKNTGEYGKLQRNETDAIKKEYCKANDIPLYEIRYDEKDIIEQRVREILTELNLI